MPGISKTGFKRFRIFIRIDKLLARVLWRIDMDHLDLAVIRLLESFNVSRLSPTMKRFSVSQSIAFHL